jgi:hypothetical protein
MGAQNICGAVRPGVTVPGLVGWNNTLFNFSCPILTRPVVSLSWQLCHIEAANGLVSSINPSSNQNLTNDTQGNSTDISGKSYLVWFFDDTVGNVTNILSFNASYTINNITQTMPILNSTNSGPWLQLTSELEYPGISIPAGFSITMSLCFDAFL